MKGLRDVETEQVRMGRQVGSGKRVSGPCGVGRCLSSWAELGRVACGGRDTSELEPHSLNSWVRKRELEIAPEQTVLC